jgi:hypothetical protein
MFSSRRGQLRVLDFDLENRPLSYIIPEWCSAEITAIAWSWLGSDEVETLLLTARGKYVDKAGKHRKPLLALGMFREILLSADLVTGHYIRGHDLPILNAAFIEYGVPSLGSLLVSDTKSDLIRKKDMSASQENLAATLGLPEPKRHMTQAEWREANRLFSDDRLDLSRSRVVGDVVQHKALRAELVRRKLLGPPRRWSSTR